MRSVWDRMRDEGEVSPFSDGKRPSTRLGNQHGYRFNRYFNRYSMKQTSINSEKMGMLGVRNPVAVIIGGHQVPTNFFKQF